MQHHLLLVRVGCNTARTQVHGHWGSLSTHSTYPEAALALVTLPPYQLQTSCPGASLSLPLQRRARPCAPTCSTRQVILHWVACAALLLHMASSASWSEHYKLHGAQHGGSAGAVRNDCTMLGGVSPMSSMQLCRVCSLKRSILLCMLLLRQRPLFNWQDMNRALKCTFPDVVGGPQPFSRKAPDYTQCQTVVFVLPGSCKGACAATHLRRV